jgi:hypothetical protein
MKKTRFISVLAIAVSFLPMLSSCFSSQTAEKNKDPTYNENPAYMETTQDYGLLRWENKSLFNNQWGQGYLSAGATHTGKMYYDPAARLIGWEWSWPYDRPQDLKAYPALIIGDKPFPTAGVDQSTDPRFPLYLPDVKELWFEGDIDASGTGDFNFAFDLNLLDERISRPDTIRTEIMIWVYANKACGAKKTGTYVIDGVPYDLHVNTDWNPAIPYVAFVRSGTAVPKKFPLHEFFAIAYELGFYGPKAYLSAIELGAEIWHGNGQATVRNCNLILKTE